MDGRSLNQIISQNSRAASSSAAFLQGRADCARVLGMGALADDLDSIAHDIVMQAERVSQAYGDDLSDQLAQTRSGIASTLRTILSLPDEATA